MGAKISLWEQRTACPVIAEVEIDGRNFTLGSFGIRTFRFTTVTHGTVWCYALHARIEGRIGSDFCVRDPRISGTITD